MKTSQKRAIWYAERERRFKRLEDYGLLAAYKAWNKGHHQNRLAVFAKKNNIIL